MSSRQYVIKYWSLQPSSQTLTHFLKSLKNAKRFEEEKGFYGIISNLLPNIFSVSYTIVNYDINYIMYVRKNA